MYSPLKGSIWGNDFRRSKTVPLFNFIRFVSLEICNMKLLHVKRGLPRFLLIFADLNGIHGIPGTLVVLGERKFICSVIA